MSAHASHTHAAAADATVPGTAETPTGPSRRDAVVRRLFLGAIGALKTLHVYVGDTLGLYLALAKLPDAAPAELAGAAGIAERYAREWLEQQAVAGLMDVVRDDGDATNRRYRLPAEAAEVMTDADRLSYLAPLASQMASLGQAVPPVLEAFRTAGGVPYPAYGDDLCNGIARLIAQYRPSHRQPGPLICSQGQ